MRDQAGTYVNLIAFSPTKSLVTRRTRGQQPPKVVQDEILAPLVARYGTRFGGLTGWQFSTHTADHRYWNERLARALRQ